MNTGHLKSYAPQARKDFIAAVTARANLLGLSEVKGALKTVDAQVKNDIVMIAGRAWPVQVDAQRRNLIERMQLVGFAQTVEAVAYAWFNRLAALRFMELHDYLGHGRRVLSNPQDGLPEVLAHALELAESGALPGLSTDTVRELKLSNRDSDLYRLVLIAQCNALHQAMPFLFEQLGDETELLLPDNLLHTDSVVAKLEQSIPEQDWQQIEIIGWLYQFYISEKKGQVIGKVVKPEDIPAATQLFTPNWIVKYMVQNSLGAQWLATYPDSPLKAQMAYYIDPAEQTDEVNAQLAEITPSVLNPEEMTLIDPACGSGHILVEAYDVFKAIYLERGYRQRDVAKLILEKNLFGLDIDERAAQLAGFALMMKGRADDRQLFGRRVKLNVMALVNSAELNVKRLVDGVTLADYRLEQSDLVELKRLFEHASTFGSLIQVPKGLVAKLSALKQLSETTSQDIFASKELKRLAPLVRQIKLLAAQYDAVVANPPYMGAKAFTSQLKDWLRTFYRGNDKDLFSAFIARMLTLTKRYGYSGVMTSFVWMFIKSFQQLRKTIVEEQTINSLVQLHYDAFADAKAHVCTFILQKVRVMGKRSSFIRLSDFPGVENQGPKTLQAIRKRDCGWFFVAAQDEFARIPGSPIAYWIQNAKPFDGPRISDKFVSGGRTKTHGNEQFVRHWWELDIESRDWAPYAMGGEFRKYSGNLLQVVNWSDEARSVYESYGGLYPEEFWHKEGITWGKITSARVGFREKPQAAHYDSGAGAIFTSDFVCDPVVLGFLNSPIVDLYIKALNPTVNTTVNDVLALPLPTRAQFSSVDEHVRKCVSACRTDWDAYERSRDFQVLPLLPSSTNPAPSLESGYSTWTRKNRDTIAEMKRFEEENNRLFIDAYSMGEEVNPNVPMEQITLTVNPAYRYGGKLTEEEQWTRFRQDTMAELVSYAIGCMMGRYSLNGAGLIYAHSDNVGFDASRYVKFPADADGIVPLTGDLWFEDDAALRIREFLRVVWGAASLEENMAFLAENLGRKSSESPEEAIRRYLADKFFKDHLQTYKKRPIYWLFSSGKQGAFQALAYLHRYNAGTLSRLRAEYVVPLTGKMQGRIEQLEKDVAAAGPTAVRNRLNKQLERLHKQHLELMAYDEQLRHYADQRIELDLDDGVKANYGKFGDLLAEVKAVVGKKEED